MSVAESFLTLNLSFRRAPVAALSGRASLGESGATMVEFTFSLILIIGLFALIFDGALAIWRHNILSDTLARVATDRSIHLDEPSTLTDSLGVSAECGSCGDLDSCISSIGGALLAQRSGSTAASFFLDFHSDQPPGSPVSPRRFITVRGEWPLNCLFCSIFTEGFTLQGSERRLLEVSERVIASKELAGCSLS